MWHGFKVGVFVVLIVVLMLSANGDFSSASRVPAPVLKTYQVTPVEIPLTASYVVFDAESGRVLFAHQESKVRPIASVTKLFTAAALLPQLEERASTTIAYTDVLAAEDFGKLHPGEEYQLRELLFPLLLESSNDAAVHFERVTDGLVVKHMNQLAKEVGLQNTEFADASGLSAHNVSTATDVAHFLSYLYRTQSHVLDITTLTQYVGPYTGWVNNSPVLDKTYRGGKHGYTEQAGRTGAVLFSENISGTARTIGYIVLGGADLAEEVAMLRGFVQTHVRYE